VTIDESNPVAVLKSVRSALKVPERQSMVAYAMWASRVVDWACRTYDSLDCLELDYKSFEYGIISKLQKDFPQ